MKSYNELESYIKETDVSLLSDYNRIILNVDQLISEYETANQVYYQLGSTVLRQILQESSPATTEELLSIKNTLSDTGVAVLNNTRANELKDESSQLLSITLSNMFGIPTKTDRKLEQIAWPIKFDPDAGVVRTFSQTLGEAAFHTDTQYFEKPEKYFGLFCIVADTQGKGTNELISGKAIETAYKETYGDEDFDVLKQEYPFKVPSVFTKSARDDDIEITWAPIFEDSNIRYRKDTIDGALASDQIEISATQHEALERLEKIINEIKPYSYHLNPGDAIIVNNHKLLHARTAFTNPERLLYRVRMDDNEI